MIEFSPPIKDEITLWTESLLLRAMQSIFLLVIAVGKTMITKRWHPLSEYIGCVCALDTNKCYSCNSNQKSSCVDPFDSDSMINDMIDLPVDGVCVVCLGRQNRCLNASFEILKNICFLFLLENQNENTRWYKYHSSGNIRNYILPRRHQWLQESKRKWNYYDCLLLHRKSL